MYLMAAIFSLTGYLGINFVLVLVRSFGALLAVTGIYYMYLIFVCAHQNRVKILVAISSGLFDLFDLQ